jgi:thiol-disulfide isomerase/thioredoxin
MKAKNTSSFNKTILITFLVVGIAAALYLTFQDQLKKIDKFSENKLTVVAFTVDWCGHCKKYKASGMFEQTFKTRIQPNDAYAGVVFQMLNYDQVKDGEIAGVKVSGLGVDRFPTILAIDADKKVHKFSGDRDSPADLEEFVKTLLKQ